MEIVSDSSPMAHRRLRLTQSQFGLMVDFMLLNPELGKGKKPDRSTWSRKWVELAHLLNSNGAGPRKSVERWRKSWSDLKNNLRNKIKKVKNCEPLSAYITEVELKAWSLIKPNEAEYLMKKWKSDKCVSEVGKTVNNHLQELEGSEYYILTLNDINQLKPCENFKSNSAREGDTDSERLRENSEETSENSDDAAEKDGTENKVRKRESEIKHSSILTVIANSEEGWERDKAFGPVIQDLSKSTPRKKLKIWNCETVKQSRQEIEVIPLLQRQNELLEKITQTLVRIEKSLEASSSHTTNGAVNTIAENIDKMATCLSSVSTTLKSVGK